MDAYRGPALPNIAENMIEFAIEHLIASAIVALYVENIN